ncbi:filamentous hemagglutinin N-terminal domain-containing protein [Nostoc sp. ChiQUE01b]|uniref:two-partner secretion domain-containing protein n=1 Tax=Nostoc sp. ChiQUE01b TaxID=3075376 RepID=UPI002AD4D4E1|nr:filamentous hemagglutinin N-terminal domain-containing protein [Nostoc sp. ChiQUE01b]MDZ8263325.1 filamentous hemagglutinin N-terminal domain-containing protein [Nostoc sp. ChiQUE01b]
MSFRTARLDWLHSLGIAIGSAIALYANISVAQITPDGTLPNNSNVTLENNTFKITGGSQARGNLFHSFKDFSVPTGSEAFFNNPANIQNIISRVTGNFISNIDGLIRANGTANLFLINPNGIIFGENARLNIGGSFFATSANSMKFTDGFEFSAKNPQSTPLLTINVPIGLQFGSNSASVLVRGSSLQVNPGRNLTLVGGNVSMDGGKLVAPSGSVELGGVAGENTVGLFSNGDFLGLNIPQGVPQADVSLTNQAEVNVLASSGGNIAINAANLNISKGSQLITGISGVGSSKTQAGDIKINATGIVALADSSNISNQVLENAVGNSGNININADSLSLSNNSFLAASTNGRGNTGNITINTKSLSVFEGSYLAANANGEGDAGNININAGDRVLFDLGGQAYTNVTTRGKGGDISISTGLLTVSNGSKLNASTSGVGNAGNISFSTGSFSVTNNSQVTASTSGVGNAGNITINTDSLFVTNESFLASSANGRGNAGNITIDAGNSVSFENGAKVYTDVNQLPGDTTEVKGNGGDIKITSGSVSLTNGAQLISNTQGEGNAGNIIIDTGRLSVANQSYLAANANGEGDAGNININAGDRVLFDLGGQAYTNVATRGKGGDISISTELLTVTNGSKLNASTAGVGNAGNITFSTGSFSVTNNSQVTASTSGVGKAGDLTINTDSIFVTNESFLAASANGRGNAGNITIDARNSVSLENGAKVYTDVNQLPGDTTQVEGNGGDIKITSESVSLTNGAQLISNTQGEGNAGNITIDTGTLFVTNESFLTASANGENGDAGNITINAGDRVLFDRAGQAYTNVATRGKGGDISISTELLTVTNGSKLNASTAGVGKAGDLTINTDSIFVTNESFLAASANGRGNAGNITIDARNSVSLENGAKVYTDVNQLPGDTTQVEGNGGDIKITSESVSLTNGAQLISNTQGEGNAGNITIDTGTLSVAGKSFLAASANGRGNAGNITINARDRLLFDQGSAFSNVGICSLIAVGCTLSNNTIKGNGGNIRINAPSLQLINGSFLATGVGDNNNLEKKVEGNAGDISIYLKNDLSLDKSFITTILFANGKGEAGDIDIQAGFISSYQSLISASTQGQGNAGGVSLKTTGTISLADSDISTAVQKGATGDAQGINITARSLLLTDGAQLNTVTSGEGKAGNIFINTTDQVSVSGTNTTVAPSDLFQNNIPPRFNSPPQFVDGVSSGIFTSTNSFGVGGNITVNTNTFSISKGAVVDARTTASGTGGAININTNTIDAMLGGQLSAIASGNGRAGNITLNATDSVTITDSDPTYSARLAQFVADNIDIYGKPKVGNQGAASGLTVSSVGSGSAGDLTVQANSIRLDNGAKISADTTGGGGDIFLNSPLLLLRRGSNITTNASGNDITGGNITIDAKNGFIIAVPNENSDIRADSAKFRGGNVTIRNAASIFGIQSRKEPSPNTNDITAKGATPDLSGNVQINTPDVNPSNGLVELPINLVDASRQISTACTPGTRQFQNTFVATGRGGLPMSPTEPLQDSSTVSAWVKLRPKSKNLANTTTQAQPTAVSTTSIAATIPIVEASGWVIDRNGNIELVAQVPQLNPHSPWQTPASCPVSQ